MGIQPNPYAQPPAEALATYPAYAPAPVRDDWWWVPPALFTPLVLLCAYLDFRALPLGFAFGYLVPVAMVVAAWLTARTVRRRPLSLVLGALACVFAFLYAKLLFAAVMLVFFVALLTGNVQA
ncbi:hypothetical protein [Streptomyces sp. NPDC020681]|uniref:hypothetical protein n=1 Tax=Streptomyces sp. NPDC020681 TaxID=3365083 RepID=UPI0037B515B9